MATPFKMNWRALLWSIPFLFVIVILANLLVVALREGLGLPVSQGWAGAVGGASFIFVFMGVGRWLERRDQKKEKQKEA